MVIPRIDRGIGGGGGDVIKQASGPNSGDGPSLPVIGAVAVAAYAAWRVLM